MAENTIGGEGPARHETRGKRCAHCGQKFGIREFFSYVAKFWDKHIYCHTCQENNHLENSDSQAVRLIIIGIGLLIGGPIVLGAVLIISLALYSIFTGERSGGYIISGFAIIFGVSVINFVMSFLRWFVGSIIKESKDDVANEAMLNEFMNR